MKKIIKIIAIGLLCLIFLVGLLAYLTFGDLVSGALSVKKIDDRFYYMEYDGDDGFDEFVATGGAKDANQLVEKITNFLSKGHYKPNAKPDSMKFGCAAFTVTNADGEVLMGRNFDYNSSNTIVLHAKPKRGYEYISTFNLEFFGFGDNYAPEDFGSKYMALSVLFVALDGINEKGFAIADLMAGDDVETHQNTEKPDLTTTAAIAYLLKNAATVNEAIELLNKIDMHSDIGSAHHYAMTDTTGKSVVIEYVDNQMIVTPTPAVTNHYLCEEKHNVGLLETDHRYDNLCDRYESSHGIMDENQLFESIKSVAQYPTTQYTMVINLSQKSVTYYSQRKFDEGHKFELK
ncbi:MAG: linear amide C-N hydrolase [Bacteroidales bacterium]|nr:linear amide C-N hydrolase [Bacteroidales bacterium]